MPAIDTDEYAFLQEYLGWVEPTDNYDDDEDDES